MRAARDKGGCLLYKPLLSKPFAVLRLLRLTSVPWLRDCSARAQLQSLFALLHGKSAIAAAAMSNATGLLAARSWDVHPACTPRAPHPTSFLGSYPTAHSCPSTVAHAPAPCEEPPLPHYLYISGETGSRRGMGCMSRSQTASGLLGAWAGRVSCWLAARWFCRVALAVAHPRHLPAFLSLRPPPWHGPGPWGWWPMCFSAVQRARPGLPPIRPLPERLFMQCSHKCDQAAEGAEAVVKGSAGGVLCGVRTQTAAC